MFCHKRSCNLTISIHGDPSCHKQFCYLPISIHGDPSELRPEKTSTGILCHTLLLSIGVAKTPKKLFYYPKLQKSSIIQVCIRKRIQLFRVLVYGDVKKKKKLFYIIEHHFIYFTNLFHNSLNIPVFTFTYNLIK